MNIEVKREEINEILKSLVQSQMYNTSYAKDITDAYYDVFKCLYVIDNYDIDKAQSALLLRTSYLYETFNRVLDNINSLSNEDLLVYKDSFINSLIMMKNFNRNDKKTFPLYDETLKLVDSMDNNDIRECIKDGLNIECKDYIRDCVNETYYDYLYDFDRYDNDDINQIYDFDCRISKIDKKMDVYNSNEIYVIQNLDDKCRNISDVVSSIGVRKK